MTTVLRTAVLWICDIPEHKQILQEILDALSPGQRSRLNTPIAARQRIKTVLDAREHGTEEKVKEAPLTLAKQQLAEPQDRPPRRATGGGAERCLWA